MNKKGNLYMTVHQITKQKLEDQAMKINAHGKISVWLGKHVDHELLFFLDEKSSLKRLAFDAYDQPTCLQPTDIPIGKVYVSHIRHNYRKCRYYEK
jgi:hypothetical protein